MEPRENSAPQKKIQLWGSTYVTKLNGRLVMVREKKPSAFDIGLDLLGEAFGQNQLQESPGPSEESASEDSTDDSSPTTPSTPSQQSVHVNMPSPGTAMQPITGTPPAGIYQRGNQQLALLPIGAGKPQAKPQQVIAPYSNNPYANSWMASQGMMPGYGQFQSYPAIYPPIVPTAPVPIMNNPTVAVVPKCAGCGRVRSNKYQHEHPLKPGEVAAPSYCRKCQKQDTSTERSVSSERIQIHHKREKKKHRKKKGKVNQKNSAASDSDEDQSQDSTPCEAKQLKTKKYQSQEDHAFESEESHSRGRRQSPTLRIRIRNSEAGPSRAPSPLFEQQYVRRRQSLDPISRYGRRESRSPPRRVIVERSRERLVDRRQPIRQEPEGSRITYRSTYSDNDDGVRRGRGTQSRQMRSPSRPTPVRPVRVTEADREVVHTLPFRRFREKDREESNDTTLITRKSSDRRRFERFKGESDRFSSDSRSRQPQTVPELRHEDEAVAVTERYVYKTRLPAREDEEKTPRTHRRVDNAQGTGPRTRSEKVMATYHDASHYYQQDPEEEDERWRRDSRRRVSIGDTEALTALNARHSSDAGWGVTNRGDPLSSQHPSEARDPPGRARKSFRVEPRAKLSRHAAPYPLGESPYSEEPHTSTKGSEGRHSEKSRATSNHRPPFVREATDNGTEKAIPSPGGSKQRSPHFREYESDERPASRHVKFQDHKRLPDGLDGFEDWLIEDPTPTGSAAHDEQPGIGPTADEL